ncbi:unnamed protein product [Calypogeia fissa]
MATLSDVHGAVLAEETLYLGPMEVSLVNFSAPSPFPRRFLYRGCTIRTDSGIYKVNVEAQIDRRCHHNSLFNGTYVHYYRFDLVLTDDTLMKNYGKPALMATVWEAASDLLQMSPTTFAAMGELEQFRHSSQSNKDPKVQPPRSPPWSTPAEDYKSPAKSSTAASHVDSVGASGLEEEGDGIDDNSMASVTNRLASSLSSSLDIYSGSN